jgi:hypothetical protein
MTIVSTGEIGRFPYMQETNWASGASSFTFDGSDDLLAGVFIIPYTGTIAIVNYRIIKPTSPVMTLRFELRTVDATTGLPSAAGTLYGSSTSITVANPTAGNKTAAVNCTGATAGDLVDLRASSFSWEQSSSLREQRPCCRQLRVLLRFQQTAPIPPDRPEAAYFFSSSSLPRLRRCLIH